MKPGSVLILVAVAALLVAACGNDGSNSGSDAPTTAAPADVIPDPDEILDDPEGAAEELAEGLAEGLEEIQEQEGGGSATLTVGDQTWTFNSILCAFGEDQIGQEGAEFVLSSIQDGMQLYASIDSFGRSVSLNDIENFSDPSVSLEAFGADVVVDGKNVSASGQFVDGTSDNFAEIEGTFEATCP